MEPINPYQVPAAQLQTVDTSESIRLVANGQKMIIYAILIQFGLAGLNVVVGMLTGQGGAAPALAFLVLIVFLVGALAALVMSLVGLYRLLTGLGKSGLSKTVAIVTQFIPLLGVILLLVYNSQAIKALRAAGWHVGFLGASPPGSR